MKNLKQKSILIALGLIFGGLAAGALPDGTESIEGSPYIMAGSVLVTPEEVADQGGTPMQVAQQQAAWDSLSAEEYREQAALAASEHAAWSAAYDTVYTVDGQLVLGEPSQGGAVHGSGAGGRLPEIVGKMYCQTSFWTQYRISSSGMLGADMCFGGSAGTYDISGGYTASRLMTGAYTGRVQYAYGNQLYWSTKRGPSTTWRYFTDPNWVLVWKIQLY